ncbi:MAG: hypothetical protein C4518_00300 [Desulfobacteraceae bacterium]|nr:MAG: hypothetical protein C4518_00300 [Desulfobacteraceae bacterium]
MADTKAQQKNVRPENARPENVRIDKLIEFFKSLKTGCSGTGQTMDPTDNPSRNQTEEDYQAEQARWLAEINARKNADKP